MALIDPIHLPVWLLGLFALWLFSQDRVPHDTAALAFLLVLLLGLHFFPIQREDGSVAAADVFARLGHPAMVSIAALVILARALEVTGAFSALLFGLGRLWLGRPWLGMPATLLLAAGLSAFLGNSLVVVMLMPALIGIAVQNHIRPSRLLMPVGFAVLVGGMATVIGASTNLLVVGVAADLGLPVFGLFDFAWPVMVAGSLALLYLWGLAPRWLPERNAPLGDRSPRVFSAVLRIDEDSAAAGLTLPQVRALTDNQMRVDRVQRGDNLFVAKLPSLRIQPGDRLHVRDLPERLKRFEKVLGATLAADAAGATEEGAATGQQLAEIVVTRGALLHQNTLRATRFASRFGLLPLALHRARGPAPLEQAGDLSDAQLRAGDVVLVQGSREALDAVRKSGDALVLDGSMDLPSTHRAPRALLIFVAVIAAIGLNLLPVEICAVAGVALMLVCRCLTWRDMVSSLNSRLVLVIAAALALALVLQRSGAAAELAAVLGGLLAGWPLPLVLAAFMALLVVLTTLAANAIVAAIAVPVAVPLALGLDAPPQAFVLAALFGASMSFIRAHGDQTNLLLRSTGGYRQSDFARVGAPLAVLLWVALTLVLSVQYGL